MKYLLKFAVAVFLSIIVFTSAQGKSATSLSLLQQTPTGIFKGLIVGVDGKGISGATVSVESGEMKRELKSDKSGEFTVELAVGVYEILVQEPDFKSYQLTNLEVKADANLSHTFQLQSSHTLHTYIQQAYLSGEVKVSLVNLVCEPIKNARVTLKNRRWRRTITSDQDGRFTANVPAGRYHISVNSGEPRAFIIQKWKHREIAVLVDTGMECNDCVCFPYRENPLITAMPATIIRTLVERKASSRH